MDNNISNILSAIYDSFNSEQREFIQQLMDRITEQENTINALQMRCSGFLSIFKENNKCELCSLECKYRDGKDNSK